jgi:glycosyltransferase involved in cell wall biosynthesis
MGCRVAYLTNVIPSYRTAFFSRLLSDHRLDVTVFCHSEVRASAVELIPSHVRPKVVECPVISIARGRALFERLPVRKILREYDVIVSDGNPRHLGFAVLSTIAALSGKRVVIWSTLHSRRNRGLTQRIRLAWWNVFPEFLSYTEPDAEMLADRFPLRKVRSANNGLDQTGIDAAKARYSEAELRDVRVSSGLDERIVMISLGRVLPGRFDLMVPVLAEMHRKGLSVCWVLIGGGPGLPSLEKLLAQAGVRHLVVLTGPLHREDQIARWFGVADVFVYPEAIGLSLFHAFGYGLPVVTHGDHATHGPEMAAFEEGITGLTFRPGDALDMARQVMKLIDDESLRRRMGENALAVVRGRYNSETMYRRFVAAMLEQDHGAVGASSGSRQ